MKDIAGQQECVGLCWILVGEDKKIKSYKNKKKQEWIKQERKLKIEIRIKKTEKQTKEEKQTHFLKIILVAQRISRFYFFI